jgi:hypothetical protein
MAMAEAALAHTRGYAPSRGSSLVDVVDLILDKGLVIDAYVRVSVIGIELLVIDARVVVASVDTYLRFAEAVNRLDLTQTKEATTYQDLVKGGTGEAAESGAEGALRGAGRELSPKRRLEERRQRKEKDSSEGEAEQERETGGGSQSDEGQDRDRSSGESDRGRGVMNRLRQRGKYS